MLSHVFSLAEETPFLYTNELNLWFWIWLILEISIEIAKKLTWTTFSNGYLGSRNDEERSEMRYVVRIAKLSESSKFWTQIALLGIPWSMLLWESILYQLEHVKVCFYGQVRSNLWRFWLLTAFCVWITGSTILCYLRLVLFALCLLIDLLVALQARNTGDSLLNCQSFFVMWLWILCWLVVRCERFFLSKESPFDSDLKWSKATRWI